MEAGISGENLCRRTENSPIIRFDQIQNKNVISFNRTRLYRDGDEIEPLMIDEAYDFNFQETRMLKEERQVYLVSASSTI